MTPDELLAIGDRVVAGARRGEGVEVVVTWSRDTEIRAYEGAVEQFTSATSAGVGIRVVADQRQGFAYAGTLDPAAVDQAFEDARDNAAFSSVDQYAGLAQPDGVAAVDLALHDERLAATSTDDRIAMAIAFEELVRTGDPRIVGIDGGADYSDTDALSAIVSTNGIRTAAAETGCALSVYSIAEADGDVSTGFGFSVGRHPGELDMERAAADAVQRAVRMLGARPAASERLTVILDPWVTAQFLSIVAEAFSADSVLKGRSLFAGRQGELVASELVTLVDDPTDRLAWGASPTDGEGIATRRTNLIDAGVASGFLYDSYTARAMGGATTGSAVRHGFMSTPSAGAQAVSLVSGEVSRDELLATVGDAVLVQEVAGMHSGVNPVSGDFSTGIEGLRLRGGEAAEPIREVTIASTLLRMLGDVVAVGSDLEYFPFDAAGVSLAIADVTLSGA
ncbi:MAG TPA: TldD/PmbA family protein [Microthrixaceae bacterium]|nr:TldD/PmbA family protein [Microthrixaceae bacterium]